MLNVVAKQLIRRLYWHPRIWLYRLKTLPGPLVKRLRVVYYSLVGGVLGLFLLHPFAMLVCQLSGMFGDISVAEALAHSFDQTMWLMWVFYATLGSLAGCCAAFVVNRIRLIDGLVKICAWCGRIQVPGMKPDGPPAWKRLDFYLMQRGIQETHGICPDCMEGYRKRK